MNGELHLFFEQRPDDGYKNGLLTSWYPNGQKEYEGTFKNREYDGLQTTWYENGQKKQEGTENEWTYWNEDGSAKIDLPFLQQQAPHSWGFLFVG